VGPRDIYPTGFRRYAHGITHYTSCPADSICRRGPDIATVFPGVASNIGALAGRSAADQWKSAYRYARPDRRGGTQTQFRTRHGMRPDSLGRQIETPPGTFRAGGARVIRIVLDNEVYNDFGASPQGISKGYLRHDSRNLYGLDPEAN
jgi:hypothetical protein